MDNLLRLLNIMQTLRDPENGCPWDIQQTFETILPHTLEEVYEVAEAIDQQDYSQLKDELGDLLLQIVYYSQMAREQDLFEFEDVARGISDKLVRRHPHVFAKDNPELQKDWEQIKQEERVDKSGEQSLLNDIPAAMPQLMRAKKIQKRVASVGFDWDDLKPVIAKVEEELSELKQAIASDHSSSDSPSAAMEEELGDLLFSVVNLSRHIHVNSEEALRKSNTKFIARFQFIENHVEKLGKGVKDCSLDELEEYWQLAKKKSI